MIDNEVCLQLSISIRYQLGTATVDELSRLLHNAADHLAGNGLMTGTTDAEVVSWSSCVRPAKQITF